VAAIGQDHLCIATPETDETGTTGERVLDL
jgi:hypothetical protein